MLDNENITFNYNEELFIQIQNPNQTSRIKYQVSKFINPLPPKKKDLFWKYSSKTGLYIKLLTLFKTKQLFIQHESHPIDQLFGS